MNNSNKSYCVLTIFFSLVLVTLLILTGSTTLVFSQTQNDVKSNDNSNINENFNATLTGSQQVPPVKTKGFGTASFELLKDNKTLHYQISIVDVQNITKMHIHQGKSGENGDVIVNIYEPTETIVLNQNGTKLSEFDSSSVTIDGNTQSTFMVSGTINNSDFKGPLSGKNISDLINLMKNGDTYVNVHTNSHPDGEIRGQIMKS